jgi:uncharacterized membrane protein (DUF106 family)
MRRFGAALIIVVAIIVGVIHLFIKSWMEETKRQEMEKRGENYQEDFTDMYDD